jgi:uncharacterized protein
VPAFFREERQQKKKKTSMRQAFLQSFRLACFLFTFISTTAQQQIPLINSGDVLRKGTGLQEKGDYENAIREFLKIERNDTNYALALAELCHSYIAFGQDSLAVHYAEKGIRLNSDYQNYFYLYKGNALGNLKKNEESLQAYEAGIRRFPKNNTFYFEIGTSLFRQEKYPGAKKYFMRSVEMNPYHPGSHYYLGILSLKEGKIIPAMMALQFYLILEPGTPRAQKTVSILESVVKGEYKFEEGISEKTVEGEDDFAELEAIIKSKIAISEKYKAKTDLEYALVKQVQVFLEKLEVNKSDKGFFMRTYAPFYAELNKKNFLEAFAYSLLSGMSVEKINRWISKHESDFKKFGEWAVEYIGNDLAFKEEEMNGERIKVRHWYENSRLEAEGNRDAAKNLTGYWKFYYPSGQLKSEGAYNSKGEKSGVWKWYYQNGNLKEKTGYANGKEDGEKTEYYATGVKQSRLNFSNGLIEGENALYYPTGVTKGSYQYKGGKPNGPEIHYYMTGKKSSAVEMVNGIATGPFTQYYESGNIKEISTIENGNRNGLNTEYFDLPGKIKKSEGLFKEGNQTGDWKFYHENGKLSEEGKFNEKGLRTGVWKSYDEKGQQADETTYTENGKLSGPYTVFENGKVFAVYEYKNGELMSYKFTAADGKVLGEAKKSGKILNTTYYYPDGNKKMDGILKNDQAEGEVNYYNENGVLTAKENYEAGKLSGTATHFHTNGRVQTEVNYTDNLANGYFKKFFASGRIASEGWYVNGAAQGTWIDYFPNGKKFFERYFLNDAARGWQVYYLPNGKMDREELYEDELNVLTIYYDSLGKVADSLVFPAGNGEFITHFPNGKVRTKVSQKAGFLQGKLYRYFYNGKLESEGDFVDGNENGLLKTYWLNGKIRMQANYQNGIVEGSYKIWNEDGTPFLDWNYKDGYEDGLQKSYNSQGKLYREAEYSKGKVNGFIKLYDDDGTLIVSRKYEDDRLISYSFTGKDGKMLSPVPIKNETGTIAAFYQGGEKSLEATYKSGSLEGKRTEWHSNGKLSKEEFFVSGAEEGVQKYYYRGGQLRSEEEYLDGKHYGRSAFYFENGKVEREEFYLDNEAYGTWKFFNPEGKLLKTQTWYNGMLLDEKTLK